MGDIGEQRRHYEVLAEWAGADSAVEEHHARMPDPQPLPTPQPEPLPAPHPVPGPEPMPVPGPVPIPDPVPQPPSESVR